MAPATIVGIKRLILTMRQCNFGGVEEKEFAAVCPWLGVSRDFSFTENIMNEYVDYGRKMTDGR